MKWPAQNILRNQNLDIFLNSRFFKTISEKNQENIRKLQKRIEIMISECN